MATGALWGLMGGQIADLAPPYCPPHLATPWSFDCGFYEVPSASAPFFQTTLVIDG